MAKKLHQTWGSNPRPCAPLFTAEQLLRLAFFWLDLSALGKWLFGRITLRRSPFFMTGSRAQPLNYISYFNYTTLFNHTSTYFIVTLQLFSNKIEAEENLSQLRNCFHCVEHLEEPFQVVQLDRFIPI